LRRKSMARSSRAPLDADGVDEALVTVAVDALLPPSITTTLLPTTRVSYGTSLSRFITRRVRALGSAATVGVGPRAWTARRLEGIASVVFGRSKEMRAGLSMVNDSGCGAGPDRRMVTCTCCPGSGCTSIDCNAG